MKRWMVALCACASVSSARAYERCEAGAVGAGCVEARAASRVASAAPDSQLRLLEAFPGAQVADADVVISIVRQRSGQVTLELLRSVLSEAAGDRALPVALEDTLQLMVGLAFASADVETQAQTVTTGVVRIALTTALGLGLQKKYPGCGVPEALDAAYEGLAKASTLTSLGFPLAKGVVPERCRELQEKVTAWAEVLGAVGDVGELDLERAAVTSGCGEQPPDGASNDECGRARSRLAARSRAVEGLTSGQQEAARLADSLSGDFAGAVKRVVHALGARRPISRGDLVKLVTGLGALTLKVWPEGRHADAKKLVEAFFAALPSAIKEDETAKPSHVRLDPAALASRMVGTYVDDHQEGFYLRATIGVGGLVGFGGGQNARVTPSLHEELGVGYRWRLAQAGIARSVLSGPHIGVSGLLFKLQLNGQATDNVFVFAGWSFNLYRLIDVSLSAGALYNPSTGGARGGVVVSLQVPLADYVTDVVSSPGVEASQ